MTHAFPPTTEVCFLDANILYYDVITQPALSEFSSTLVREIVTGQRKAATTLGAIADAVHKVMFSEAAMLFNRPRAGLLAWIKNHPEAIQQLSVFRAAAEKYATLPLNILEMDVEFVRRGADISANTGLLTNDAILVAAMEIYEIRHLVTNDDDFDHVPNITVWKPR